MQHKHIALKSKTSPPPPPSPCLVAAVEAGVPVSQDVAEVKCAALLGGETFSHQVEDAEAVLLRAQVDQAGLLQHVRM